ncbi:WhiB family transcriptional regulator [Streptomyces johnsoniae]|uniref:WhiB family transcriptional regulator n=1 Tax=Streptomyces johnsoniae TaxID=3075532 RepID=A0ABU2S014_9ACTN|nr:WhiB family transcriptional regulator [Streptomyces sp. DSM 41886]MDT0442352.1 WhiB family transcriptional regulator [Streptomyces sp. DSM 41886]
MLIDLERRWMWRPDRACASVPLKVFFPPGPTNPRNPPSQAALDAAEQAKRICAGCPVMLECRRDTLGEPYGVWGGEAEWERRERRRQVAASAASWPEATRLAWGRLCRDLYNASGHWSRVQERTGLSGRLAQTLVSEYIRSQPRKNASAPPEGAITRVLDWPEKPGTKHAWVWHGGRMKDAHIRGVTPDGSHYYVSVASGHSHSHAWVQREYVRIYGGKSDPPLKERLNRAEYDRIRAAARRKAA